MYKFLLPGSQNFKSGRCMPAVQPICYPLVRYNQQNGATCINSIYIVYYLKLLAHNIKCKPKFDWVGFYNNKITTNYSLNSLFSDSFFLSLGLYPSHLYKSKLSKLIPLSKCSYDTYNSSNET